ncbi:MAG: CAP domain-containing protein [Butyrivibrio sp.]|nr:CAP domain-containing protein [Butyrivibrio sp.]
MKKGLSFGVVIAALVLAVLWGMPVTVHATETSIDAKFDYKYYADTYPDVKKAYGYNKEALWNHYVQYGKKEGRKCYEGDPGGTVGSGGDSSAGTANTPKASGTADVKDGDPAAIMLEQLNAYRASKKLEPLELSQKCLDVANVRAAEIGKKFSHKRPNGTKFITAYKDSGYARPTTAGENCTKVISCKGVVADSIPIAMEDFKGSPSHNKAMLRKYWKYVGFGFYVDSKGNVFVTQEFSAD